jgi:hypothetical protein
MAELKLIQKLQKFKMSFANAGEIFELSTSGPMALPAKSYEPAMGMPRFVSELQPWGVVDLDGALIGFRFMNPSGDDTNVMAASDISPNALVFHAPPPRRLPKGAHETQSYRKA